MKKTLIAIISLTLALTLTFLISCVPSAANGNDSSVATDGTDNVAESTETTTNVVDDAVESNKIITNVSEANCIHEFVNVTGTTFHGVACKECGFISEQYNHKLTAYESYHQWDCDECGRTRLYHDEDSMQLLVKNEFFHLYSCATCGYEYAENHNFSTSYNSEYHQEVCVDCGYATDAEAHIMINDFYGNYHDIQCDFCGYMAEHHVGTNFETVDSTSCMASCNCGVIETIEHEWDGFVCDHCHYTMGGDTYAIVGRISKNNDGDYRVRFINNNGTHRVDMWDVSGFEEGDFVRINHYGNDIFNVTVIVAEDILYDEENFYDYISDEINEKSEDLVFEDLIIEEFEYFDSDLVIDFESGRSVGFFNFSEFIVYDLIDGRIGELMEDYAYLTIYVGDVAYFICFW